jgi:hypothetical protein
VIISIFTREFKLLKNDEAENGFKKKEMVFGSSFIIGSRGIKDNEGTHC